MPYYNIFKTNCQLIISPAGIPTNTAKPASYSVRMEASVPLATQAPSIQPLQIRPGVITQVKWIVTQVMLTDVI